MNRFFKKDKGPVEDHAVVKEPKKSKKGKKAQEEEDIKPEFSLEFALPKADDFRTSLIMPGLSTRFSMLREQDDPNSKLGKACDDSVLQPKRQSRLQEFGFNTGNLDDIAEVSSMRSSVRPPHANDGNSLLEDDSGSIMTRARPGEGNVLFGGRQKIYMISNNSTKGLGRTLYDDDVGMSAYQRLRMEEKEKLRQAQDEEQSSQQSEPSSPTARSQKRETSSSTNSGPLDARTSTAATSIASQATSTVSSSSSAFPPLAAPASNPELNRTGTKPRRLYDQGLDQQLQDQQSSGMSRLTSLQRARAPTGRSTPPLSMSQTRSATNLGDRFQRGPVLRSDSSKTLGHPDTSRNNSSAGSSPALRCYSPSPASPVVSENEDSDALKVAVQPQDRGKATAMGAFNKPKEAFSEQQYEERLKQMQQEREVREAITPKVERSPPRKPISNERTGQEKRSRAASNASEQNRSEAPAEPHQPSAAFSVFQAAASQMRTAPALPHTPISKPSNLLPQDDVSQPPPPETTFLHSRGSSDDDMPASIISRPETARRFENLPVATGPAPSIFEHPALRSCNTSTERVDLALEVSQNPIPQLDVPSKGASKQGDSPTLGPKQSGLGGMIRQHLRNDSNVSSISGDDQSISGYPTTKQAGSETATLAASNHGHSNPWDLDDICDPYQDLRASGSSDGQRVSNDESSAHMESRGRRNHERNESELEHEAFQRDLAYRQRLIQENLRARAEGRSTSPAPGPSGGLKAALNLLRAKSSHESFATVQEKPLDIPNKGLRKLALGVNSANVSSVSLAGSSAGEHWRGQKPSGYDSRQRSGTDASTRAGRSAGRNDAVSTRSSTRERSSSGTSSGRSRGRSGYDSERPSTDSMGNAMIPPMPGYVHHPPPPIPHDRPSLESEARMRSRSGSRPPVANQLDTKHLQPIRTGSGSGNASPRLGLPSAVSQPKYSPISPRPSPGGYDMNGHQTQASPIAAFPNIHTPPTSNPTTPNAGTFNPTTVQPVRQGVLRKKSIAKTDISDPVFLSTTSQIDLIDLPPGASLKNGSEPYAPPVPPIHPMRKRFGFGRQDNQSPTHDSPTHQGLDAPRVLYGEPMRTNSSDAITNQIPQHKGRLRKASSEGRSLHGQAQGHAGPAPAMPVGFVSRHNSPRPTHESPIDQRRMDGAMF